MDAITTKANQTAKRLLNEALDVIKNKQYSLELVFITTHKSSPNMMNLVRDTMGFKAGDFSIHCYEDVMHLCSERLRDFTPPLGVYCLPYCQGENNLIRTDPHKAWVISVSLEEIRSMVNKYGDKLFRKNVRNFLGKNRCNKKIIETLENDKKSYKKFNSELRKVISKYFKIIYKSWKSSGEEYYNTYLQNSNSEEHIRKKFRREFNELHKKVNLIFNKFID